VSRYQYHACERCGCPGVETAYRFCGRCELERRRTTGACTVETREPGSDDVRPVRCVHCREDIPSGTVCRGCVELLAELGADEPSPTPASPAPERNGYWLYHDAKRQGDLQAVMDYGHEHGYPKMMKNWSRAMVAQANQARKAATRGAAH
jgi:hypothetical protein